MQKLYLKSVSIPLRYEQILECILQITLVLLSHRIYPPVGCSGTAVSQLQTLLNMCVCVKKQNKTNTSPVW